jgi:hypothetical protein
LGDILFDESGAFAYPSNEVEVGAMQRLLTINVTQVFFCLVVFISLPIVSHEFGTGAFF